MVRYQEVPAQNVVLYYVLMEFGKRTCAYLYQVADVLWVVLVRVVPVLVQNFSTGWFFSKKKCTNYTQVPGTRVPVNAYPCTGSQNSRNFEFVLNYTVSQPFPDTNSCAMALQVPPEY